MARPRVATRGVQLQLRPPAGRSRRLVVRSRGRLDAGHHRGTDRPCALFQNPRRRRSCRADLAQDRNLLSVANLRCPVQVRAGVAAPGRRPDLDQRMCLSEIGQSDRRRVRIGHRDVATARAGIGHGGFQTGRYRGRQGLRRVRDRSVGTTARRRHDERRHKDDGRMEAGQAHAIVLRVARMATLGTGDGSAFAGCDPAGIKKTPQPGPWGSELWVRE